MRKLFIAAAMLCLVAATQSCRKDNKVEPIDPADQVCTPAYQEGLYQPCKQLAYIVSGDTSQTWIWDGSNLQSIRYADGTTMYYSYTNDFISSVTTSGDENEEIRYFYTGANLNQCQIYYSGSLAATLTMQHNTEGKMSGASVEVDDSFLLSMAGNLFGKGTTLERLVGGNTLRSLVTMSQIEHKMTDGTKFSVDNKTVNLAFAWNGDNMIQQSSNASITIGITSSDIDLISQFVDIPDTYSTLIQLAIMASPNGTLPVIFESNDTINYTFDDKNNPFFCNWGNIPTGENLSINNVLTVNENGATVVSVNLMGSLTPLNTQPSESYIQYRYEYNDKDYPISVSSDDATYTYIYK